MFFLSPPITVILTLKHKPAGHCWLSLVRTSLLRTLKNNILKDIVKIKLCQYVNLVFFNSTRVSEWGSTVSLARATFITFMTFKSSWNKTCITLHWIKCCKLSQTISKVKLAFHYFQIFFNFHISLAIMNTIKVNRNKK